MSGINRVVIVGGGQAGGEAAAQLRSRKFAGSVTLVGEEPLAPYQRPPLSKKYLAGEWAEDRLPLRPPEIYAEEGIDLLLGVRVSAIDRPAKTVKLSDGRALAYDALVLATGSRPRPLPVPGMNLAGVFYLRTAADVDAIRPRFQGGARLVVIGAGYIGLEVAAVGRERGLDVTVVESLPRPLSRVTSPELAGFFHGEHISKGAKFVLGAMVAEIKGEGQVRAVGLSDGSEIPADLVIVGAGITPETSLAEAAGLEVAKGAPPENGIVTDAECRTSDPAIFAIGDCARRPIALVGRAVRLESVHNAIEGGKIVAAAISGTPPPNLELPWFWSDQYDLKLTIGGLFQGYDEIVVRGNMADRSFALFYYKAGRLLAVDAVNRQADYLGAKLALQRGATLPPEWVADDTRAMKEIVAAAR